MSGMQRWTPCVECKEPVKHPGVYGDCCSRECCGIRDAYERGREEERAEVVAWLRDRADQYEVGSGIPVAICEIAAEVQSGEYVKDLDYQGHEVKR